MAVATVLTACGIETKFYQFPSWFGKVATVLTACGIETQLRISNAFGFSFLSCNSTYRLRYWNLMNYMVPLKWLHWCCNSTYRLRYWNRAILVAPKAFVSLRCNSTYRLRYWNMYQLLVGIRIEQHVATVLTACGIETWFFHYQPSIYLSCNSTYRLRYWNIIFDVTLGHFYKLVATVLTVYGIETLNNQQIL